MSASKTNLKDRLSSGAIVTGTFVFTSSLEVVEIVGRAGMDFALIDLEHSPKDWSTIQAMILAAEVGGCAPLIRMDRNDPTRIAQVLELGGGGVVVPFLESPGDVESVVRAAFYPPHGSRGVCTLSRVAGFGVDRTRIVEIADRSHDGLVLGGLIETVAGVENIDRILEADPGLDVVFVGRSDLAAAMGLLGQGNHPDVLEATRHVAESVRRARRSGNTVALGIGVYNEEDAVNWIGEGAQFLCVSSDTGVLSEGLRAYSSFGTDSGMES